MFLIGILSSPLPYLMVAFVYLLGFSYGLFSNPDKDTLKEELSSNIINYEELAPVADEDTDQIVYYVSINPNTAFQLEFAVASGDVQIHQWILKHLSPPKTETSFYSCLFTSCLTNRPPPCYS